MFVDERKSLFRVKQQDLKKKFCIKYIIYVLKSSENALYNPVSPIPPLFILSKNAKKTPVFLILRQNTAHILHITGTFPIKKCIFFLTGLKIKLQKATKKQKHPPHNFTALGSHLLSGPFVKLTPAHRCTSWTSWSPGRICFFLYLGWYPADRSDALTHIKMHKKAQL